MQSVTDPPGPGAISRLDDPWWDYNTLPERNVDALFDALRRPFLLDLVYGSK
jgi:hypothetical protein